MRACPELARDGAMHVRLRTARISPPALLFLQRNGADDSMTRPRASARYLFHSLQVPGHIEVSQMCCATVLRRLCIKCVVRPSY